MESLFSIKLVYGLILMLGSLGFGLVMGYPGAVLPKLDEEFSLTSTQRTLFNSISSLTAIAGPYISQGLLMCLGRRPVTSILGLLAALFWGLIVLMSDKLFWLGILMRALLGVIMGSYSSVIPMYMVELAPKQHSGFYGVLNSFGISSGFVVIYLCGVWCTWKELAFVCMGLSIGLMALVWLVPESPANTEVFKENKESLCQKKFIKPLLIGAALMFFQQLSGINAILTNLNDLFSNVGITIDTGYTSAIASSAQVIAAVISSLIIDKIGRKVAWIISTTGSVIFLVLYALTFKVDMGPWLPIIFVFGFVLIYGIAVGPVPWFIVPELFPTSVRSLATSIASSLNWLFAFLVITAFPYISEVLNQFGVFIMFAVCEAIAIIFGWFFIDTKPAEYNDLSINDFLVK